MTSQLADALSEYIVETADGRDAPWFRISLPHWGTVASVAKAHGFTYFSYLSGMDWLPNPTLDGEHAFDTERAQPEPPEIVTDATVRIGGGTSRFQVLAHLANVETSSSVTFTSDIDVEPLTVPTWTHEFAGALWHERETWEMFGFDFVGHPGLRHIYLPEEFAGHPLRKDYALLAREVRPWPGLVDMEEMPKEPEADAKPEEDTQ